MSRTITHPQRTLGRYIVLKALLPAVLCLSITAIGQSGTPDHSIDGALAQARLDILSHDFSHAIRLLKRSLKQDPTDAGLRVELGRAYLYQGDAKRAIRQLREALRLEAQNRLAQLELARALGVRGDYRASSEIFQALLAENPADEAAAIGLTNDLMHEKKPSDALRVARQGLSQHPDSLVLQEYEDRIKQGEFGGDQGIAKRRESSVATGVNYFDDSRGNKIWVFSQLASFRITHSLSNHLSFEERHLSDTNLTPLAVVSGVDTLHIGVRRWAIIAVGGGGVRFGDGNGRSLYKMGLDLNPARSLWVGADFSRTPFSPDVTAAGYDLSAEGWNTALSWRPGYWRVNANWSRKHYSDGNLSKRGHVEVYRWLGNRVLSVEVGYRFTRIDFHQDMDHGYFDPDEYQSHLGLTGLQFKVKRVFHAKYLARVGAQSINQNDPFRSAWDLSLQNWFTFGSWEIGGGYSHFHLVQSSGAFVAQGGALSVRYNF